MSWGERPLTRPPASLDRDHRSPLPPASRHRNGSLRSSTFVDGGQPEPSFRASGVSSATWWQAAQSALPRHGGRRPSLTRRPCRHRGAKRWHRVFLGRGSDRRIGLLSALTSAPFAQQPGTPQPPGTPPHPPPDPTAPPPYEDPPRPIPIPRPDEPPDVTDDPPPNPRRNRNSNSSSAFSGLIC